jgi:hypothetical protein
MATIVGVAPHKHFPVLSAVALDERGGVLGSCHGAMSAKSLSTLLGWAAELTRDATWAIEGSNNLGRRLALALTPLAQRCATYARHGLRIGDASDQAAARAMSSTRRRSLVRCWLIPICPARSKALKPVFRILLEKKSWCVLESRWSIDIGGCSTRQKRSLASCRLGSWSAFHPATVLHRD